VIRIIHVPWWAALPLSLGFAYFLTVNLEVAIPWFVGLTDQGPLVYLESFVFVIGLVLLARGDDNRATTIMELLPTLGFFGTAIGFSQFLSAWDMDVSTLNIAGMKLAFMTTAQALFYNAVLMLVYMGSRSPPTGRRPSSDDDSWWRENKWGGP
jgi:hypothetical protein